ncbi:hypothetical protein HI914_01968 [Erysiphe necator]|nr:hypothetical protein HI914_01968 [Erysiphe necator]
MKVSLSDRTLAYTELTIVVDNFLSPFKPKFRSSLAKWLVPRLSPSTLFTYSENSFDRCLCAFLLNSRTKAITLHTVARHTSICWWT